MKTLHSNLFRKNHFSLKIRTKTYYLEIESTTLKKIGIRIIKLTKRGKIFRI